MEIIGDAYFVVGGCPTKCSDHAERVVKMALRMMEVSNSVHLAFSCIDVYVVVLEYSRAEAMPHFSFTN